MDSKKILSYILNRKTIVLWNELETLCSSHPCVSLYDLLAAIKSKARFDGDTFDAKLKEQENSNKLLTDKITELNTSLNNVSSDLQSLNIELDRKSVSLSNLESRQKQSISLLFSFVDAIEQSLQLHDSPVNDIVVNKCYSLLKDFGVIVHDDKGIFDPSYQEIIDTILTDKPEDDGLIAKSIGVGFSYEGKCIRAQKVIVYKCKL